jgi:pimeloyl-ACP methyl ester carboxylesterase
LAAAVATSRGARPEYEFKAGQLRRERTPVQFQRGERDSFGGLDAARRAVKLLPNAWLHETNARHLPFLDDPSECGRIVKEFFSH